MKKRFFFPVIVVALILLFHSVTNSSSVYDGFNPDVNNIIRTSELQSDGKILIGGSFLTVSSIARNRIARINPDGSLDTDFDPNVNNDVYSIAVQSDSRIIVGGIFTTICGSAKSNIARINPNGTLDASFNPVVNNGVTFISIQSDGKIFISGWFTEVNGVERKYLARLNEDGTLDTSFDTQTNYLVNAMAKQNDGKLIIVGSFDEVNGVSRSRLARLNADGSLDGGYGPDVNDAIHSLVLLPDGRIIIGGSFTSVAGTGRNRIARLNSNGSLDIDFNPNANDTVTSIKLQSNGKMIIGGDFTILSSNVRNRIAKIHYDGSLDTTYDISISHKVNSILLQSDNSAVISGEFTTVGGINRNCIARIYSDGSLDIDLNPTANNMIYAIAIQPSGKILIGGSFTLISGIGRANMARLNENGTLDTTFNPTLNNTLHMIAQQPDGKMVICGAFTTVGGVGRIRIARLNENGTLDDTFDVNVNSQIDSIAIQKDGKIIIGGSFTSVNSVARNRIARINPDGSLDTDFDPNANNQVNAVALQNDGKILMGGFFTAVSSITRNNIARLNPNGTLDTDFDPNLNSAVLAIAVQGDDGIIIGGMFATIGGIEKNRIARLNLNGSIDTSFIANSNGWVQSIALQTDGRIIIGGSFETINSITRNRIARLDPDGSLNNDFDPNANNPVFAVCVQNDGKILMGGNFSTISGVERSYIARLSVDNYVQQSLNILDKGTKLEWLRSGSSPEVHSVFFHKSNDGISWTELGEGIRAMDGWELMGVDLPIQENFHIKAKGISYGGYYNACSSLVESAKISYLDLSYAYISGIITDGANPLDKVAVTLSGGATETTSTSDTGFYIFKLLDHGLEYTVTPAKTNWSFDPVNKVFSDLSGNVDDADFVGTIDKWSISGIITDSEDPLENVTVNLSGGHTESKTTSDTGYYIFRDLEAGATYQITPVKTNWSFDPVNKVFSDLSGNMDNADFTAIIDKWSISGTVLEGADPMIGVEVLLNNNTMTKVITNDLGHYEFANLLAGVSYTVTPTKKHWTFTPIERIYPDLSEDLNNSDFTGELNKWSVSGLVRDGDFNPHPNVPVIVKDSYDGNTVAATVSSDTGYYKIIGLDAGNEYYLFAYNKHWKYGYWILFELMSDLSDINFTGGLKKWNISGTITDGTNPVKNITVNITGDTITSTLTDDLGQYEFADLNAGGTYTITPHSDVSTFEPIERVYMDLDSHHEDQDFTGTFIRYSISGVISEGTQPLAGVEVNLSGYATLSRTTTDTGYYIFADLIAGATYTITPEKTNYSFDPKSTLFSGLDDDKIQNFQAVRTFATDLENVKVYPNPCRKDKIVFENLTENAIIEIYSISGSLIKRIEVINNYFEWDLKNDNGTILASGVYIYLVKNDKGKIKIDKFAVIR